MSDIWAKLGEMREANPDKKSLDMNKVWKGLKMDQLEMINEFICSNTHMSYD